MKKTQGPSSTRRSQRSSSGSYRLVKTRPIVKKIVIYLRVRRQWSSRVISAVLKERGIVDISHQTVINFLSKYNLNGNNIETSIDGKVRLKVVVGNRLKDLGGTPIFILGRDNRLLDMHLVAGDRISVIRAMIREGWYLQALQSLNLRLYSLISPYDLQVRCGTTALATKLSSKLQDFVRGKRTGNKNRLISEFLNEK